MNFRETALQYYDQGLSVVPIHTVRDGKCSCGSDRCQAPGKHPRIRWRATSDRRLTRAEIETLWNRFPDSNVGIVTGKISDLVVIDIDGPEGLASLQAKGITLENLPLTPIVHTGGGGWHVWCRFVDDPRLITRAGILTKVDLRASGGIIVAPPSVHRSGTVYSWMVGKAFPDIPIAQIDLLSLLSEALSSSSTTTASDPQTPNPAWYRHALEGVAEGERNSMATRLIGRWLAVGLSVAETKMLIEVWNGRNQPPLPEEEIDRTLQSLLRREADDREEQLAAIGTVLHLPVADVRRISGDSPRIVIEFDDGNRCILTTSQLLSPAEMQEQIVNATKKVIRKLSSKTLPTHEQLAQLILNAAEEVDAGSEATEDGELTFLLREFLSNLSIVAIQSEDPRPATGVYRMGDRIWIPVSLFRHQLTRWGININLPTLSQRLRTFGAERAEYASPGGQIVAWGIDPSRLNLPTAEAANGDD